MDDKPQNIEQLIKEYNEQKQQIDNLNSRLSTAILDCNEYQKKNEDLIHDNQRLNQKNHNLVEQFKEQKSNSINLARLNGQLESEVNNTKKDLTILIEERSNIDRLVEDLKTKLEYSKHQLDESNKRNQQLAHKIEEVTNEMKKIEKELDRVKEESTITNIKIEPNIYLKGMFESFDTTTATLKILLEGSEYYYPLQEYKSEHLPVSGSRVLIFKDTNGKIMIFGFDVSKLIPEGPKIQATLKAMVPSKNELRLTTKEYGYITVKVTDSFLHEVRLNQSDAFILKQTYIDGDFYFTLEEGEMIQYNASEILKLIRG